jgi:hypothetical protein
VYYGVGSRSSGVSTVRDWALRLRKDFQNRAPLNCAVQATSNIIDIYSTVNIDVQYCISQQIPVAARSKAWICGRSFAGVVGSNPSENMDVCLLWVLCVVRDRSLRRADHSSTRHAGVCVCSKEEFSRGTNGVLELTFILQATWVLYLKKYYSPHETTCYAKSRAVISRVLPLFLSFEQFEVALAVFTLSKRREYPFQSHAATCGSCAYQQ